MKLKKKAVQFAACILISLSLFSTTAYAADYTVLPNDSLYKISQLFKTPVSTLQSDNKLSSASIYTGQKLYVTSEIYRVKSGDTMYLIAKKYGITITSLRKANNKWNDSLIPGQYLVIPGVKPGSTSRTVISYTKSEVDLLARLINAEAATQSYTAKVAVGAVVVNRVQSSEWPNTITSVINQKIGGYYQFTPVKNGYIKTPATAESISAAWAALNGNDPSHDAMFYFDDSSTNQWLWSKPITATYDSMVFVK